MGHLVTNVDDDFHGFVVPGQVRRLCQTCRKCLHVASTSDSQGSDVGLDFRNLVGERLHQRCLSPVTLFIPEVSVANNSEANFLELCLLSDILDNLRHFLLCYSKPGVHGTCAVNNEGYVKL